MTKQARLPKTSISDAYEPRVTPRNGLAGIEIEIIEPEWDNRKAAIDWTGIRMVLNCNNWAGGVVEDGMISTTHPQRGGRTSF